MFDLEAFIAECRRLVREPHGPRHVLELMRSAMAAPDEVAKAVTPLDSPASALDAPLFRSDELTVLNVGLRPGILTIPHDHAMWAVIGIYEGEEVNTFYRTGEEGLEEANRRSVHAGEAMLLGADVIHAIENPLTTQTRGLHVYGGDLLGAPRHMWDPATGVAQPYEVPNFLRLGADLARSRKAARAAV